jgi:hypothetical protein
MAAVKLCTGTVDIEKKEKKGIEIIVAHIFSLNEYNKGQVNIHLKIQGMLKDYEEL